MASRTDLYSLQKEGSDDGFLNLHYKEKSSSSLDFQGMYIYATYMNSFSRWLHTPLFRKASHLRPQSLLRGAPAGSPPRRLRPPRLARLAASRRSVAGRMQDASMRDAILVRGDKELAKKSGTEQRLSRSGGKDGLTKYIQV